jgi:hypothetical protein
VSGVEWSGVEWSGVSGVEYNIFLYIYIYIYTNIYIYICISIATSVLSPKAKLEFPYGVVYAGFQN